MRLFSIMGAYSLIANNEMLHLGIFVMMYYNKDMMLYHEYQEIPEHETAECFDLIDEKSTNLMWVHLIAFFVLFVTHLIDLLSNSFEQVEEFEKEKEKNNKN